MVQRRGALLYEPYLGGHRRVWLEILLDELASWDGAASFDFVLHSRLFDEISVRRGVASELWRLHKADAAVNGKVAALEKVANDFRPEHLLLFELTRWERGLAQRALPCRVSGVLFVQYPEIDWKAVKGAERWRRLARRWVKERRTARWLRRQKWGRVFLLQGDKAARYLNARFPEHAIFEAIADPLPPDLRMVEKKPGETPVDAARFSRSAQVRFLHVGVLSERKGMERVLAALEGISKEWAADCRVDILGGIESQYGERWSAALRRLQQLRPDIRIEWDPGELAEDDFRDEIRTADCLLLPYLRTEYSSGLLGYAAALGTPVLGAADGLIGRLIKDYGLGVVSSTTPEALRDALERARLDRPKMSEAGRMRYCADNDPRNFARKFLDVCRV